MRRKRVMKKKKREKRNRRVLKRKKRKKMMPRQLTRPMLMKPLQKGLKVKKAIRLNTS